MSNRQTIDGVPRELLTQWLAMFEGGIASSPLSALRELTRKALLDAPANPVEGLEADNVKLAADRAALSTELESLRVSYKSVLAQLDAAQHQGEPVGYRDPSQRWATIKAENKAKMEADGHDLNCFSVPLYAGKPAPKKGDI